MSHTSKMIWTAVGVVVVVVALMFIIGGAYMYTRNKSTENRQSANVTAPPLSVTSGPSTLPTGTNTSNNALKTDLSAIDSQLSGLNTDNANVDQSLNDQPVTQSSI
ncbi:hypothetical protein MNBD_CPR01-153 [hydrothermal vent metagenome]|uniref:Uncharacterized protein n=1 Tax=hydrothermal vent metagenome TaxID=652676 RepID=A0A3B0UVU3_9ZZZZ